MIKFISGSSNNNIDINIKYKSHGIVLKIYINNQPCNYLNNIIMNKSNNNEVNINIIEIEAYIHNVDIYNFAAVNDKNKIIEIQ